MCQRQSCHERNFESTCEGSASKVDSTKKRDKTTARKNTATGKRKLVGADAVGKRKKKKVKVKPEPLPSDEDISLSEVVGKRKRSTNNAEVIKIEPKQKRARTVTKKKSAVAKNIPKVTNYTSVNFIQKATKQIGLGNFFKKRSK